MENNYFWENLVLKSNFFHRSITRWRVFFVSNQRVHTVCNSEGLTCFAFFFADLKKPFTSVPYSVSVETDRNVELRCLPPDGVPPPRVYWLRNNVAIEPDNNLIVSSEGNLLIGQARLQDTANYTCVAENVAAKRLSDPALLTVYGRWCSSPFILVFLPFP